MSGYMLFSYMCSLVYRDFVPSSLASRYLIYETISILDCFGMVLHLSEQVLLQVVTAKGIIFLKTPQ